jgi:hypothetical protein
MGASVRGKPPNALRAKGVDEDEEVKQQMRRKEREICPDQRNVETECEERKMAA